MNDDKIKSQTVKPIAGNAIPTSEDHPLHILDNQIDPSKKPRKYDVPQKPIRTFEKDLEEEMAKVNASGSKIKEPGKGFFSFLSRSKKPIDKAAEKLVEKPKEIPVKPVKEKFVSKVAETKAVEPKVVEQIQKPKTFEEKVAEARLQLKKFEEQEAKAQPIIEQVVTPELIPLIKIEEKLPEIEPAIQPVIKPTAIPIKIIKQPEVVERPKVVEQIRVVEKPTVVEPPIAEPPAFITKPIDNLRTYEGDVADNIKNKNTSILTMAIAESERGGGTKSITSSTNSNIGKNISMVIASILLIAGGIYGGYYLYSISPLAVVPIKQDTRTPSIINSDIQKVILIKEFNSGELIKTMSGQFGTLTNDKNVLTEFILNKTVASTTSRVTGKDFIQLIDFNITDTLKRSLTDKWMVGMYSVDEQGFEQNLPFIILTTDFFQNAFAGMLKWEDTLPQEMGAVFGYSPSSGRFVDKVIMNRDIREYVTGSGETLFLYTFIDKDTILMTTSEAIVPIVLERIEKQTYVR